MHAPVCHQSAGIIPEPAKIKMKTACVETPGWSWSEPCFIVHARRWCAVRNNRAGFHPVLIAPDFHGTDISELTGIQKIQRVFEMFLAALPLATLYGTVIFLLSCYHGTAFANGISYR